jgi:hemerythrin
MAFMNWKETYSVNVKEFDEQHKKLVAMINELHAAMKMGKGKEAMAVILQEMVDYAASHFATEEKYMTRLGFPGYAQHRDEHSAFKKKVLDFQQEYNAGSVALSIEVMDFLVDWLVKHIQSIDKQYSQFFNTKGLK